jgi:hypothetical protein
MLQGRCRAAAQRRAAGPRRTSAGEAQGKTRLGSSRPSTLPPGGGSEGAGRRAVRAVSWAMLQALQHAAARAPEGGGTSALLRHQLAPPAPAGSRHSPRAPRPKLRRAGPAQPRLLLLLTDVVLAALHGHHLHGGVLQGGGAVALEALQGLVGGPLAVHGDSADVLALRCEGVAGWKGEQGGGAVRGAAGRRLPLRLGWLAGELLQARQPRRAPPWRRYRRLGINNCCAARPALIAAAQRAVRRALQSSPPLRLRHSVSAACAAAARLAPRTW